MGHLKHELWLLSKAEMSASMAGIVDFGLAIGLTDLNVLSYAWANLIGVFSGGVTNCCINYRYVFRQSNRKKKQVAWRYFLVWVVSLTLNGGGTNLITNHVGARYFIIVKCLMALLVAIFINYPAQRKFVFKEKDPL